MKNKIEKIVLNSNFFQDKKPDHLRNSKKFLILIIVAIVIAAASFYLSRSNIEVLNPKGTIALKETHLIYFALGLSVIVVVPVFIMLFMFAWRYRESNSKAKYSPNSDHNIFAEFLWWGIPTIIITILSVVAWNSSHALDPYKPIASSNPPITIQVIAMDWKWLFIYPNS